MSEMLTKEERDEILLTMWSILGPAAEVAGYLSKHAEDSERFPYAPKEAEQAAKVVSGIRAVLERAGR